MIRIILDKAGTLVAIEDSYKRGVVRAPGSLKRFVQALNEEFPEVQVEVDLRA